ncbi:MAG: hypothetical protein K2L85_05825 [Paramuribaculum sp.]|nr:hypothetical protein [Paramuribaculum sp.]
MIYRYIPSKNCPGCGNTKPNGPNGWNKAKGIGYNDEGVWRIDKVFSAPLWIGIRQGNQIQRLGYSHTVIQNFTQNFIHKYLTPTPYFLGYENFKSGPFFSVGSANSFSPWNY